MASIALSDTMINNLAPDDDPVGTQEDRAHLRLRDVLFCRSASAPHLNLRQRYETSVGPILRRSRASATRGSAARYRGERLHDVGPGWQSATRRREEKS